MPEKVRRQRSVPVVAVPAIVVVIVVVVTTAGDVAVRAHAPTVALGRTVTVPVLNCQLPAERVRTTFPPGEISPAAPSVMTGPLRVVHDPPPGAVEAVSAEMLALAAVVRLAVARTGPTVANGRRAATMRPAATTATMRRAPCERKPIGVIETTLLQGTTRAKLRWRLYARDAGDQVSNGIHRAGQPVAHSIHAIPYLRLIARPTSVVWRGTRRPIHPLSGFSPCAKVRLARRPTYR